MEKGPLPDKQLSESKALERKVAELERFCGKLALGERDPQKAPLCVKWGPKVAFPRRRVAA